MSIFSKLKAGKKAADEHKEAAAAAAAAAAATEVKPVKIVYKHIPTHAAVDALSGSPSSWKHEDRPRIKAEHRRRSAMTPNRSNSSLSQVMNSYSPADGIPPVPALPRNSSFATYSSNMWSDRGEVDLLRHGYLIQQESARGQSMHRGQSSYFGAEGSATSTPMFGSPLMSQTVSEEVSPVTSSSNSTSSEDGKMPEIRSPAEHQFTHNDVFDRLHKNPNRKLGDAPILAAPPARQMSPRPTIVDIPSPNEKKRRTWGLKSKVRDSVVPVAALPVAVAA